MTPGIYVRMRLAGTLALVLSGYCMKAQQTSYQQFWNEFAFTHHLNEKWSLELSLGQTWTSTPSFGSMFSSNSQLYARFWAHYHLTPKWKFSFFYSYFYNRYLPEINQEKLPELRSAYQVIYFFHKDRYILNTRMRIEDRHLKTDNGKYEAYYRFRTQLKLMYPVTGREIKKNVFYGIASEEIYLKNNSQVAGNSLVDRTRFTFGLGYSVTDDMQIEVTYVNEFLPRSDGDVVYNALQINVGFNNFIANMSKKMFHKKETPQGLESN
jgi:hypothetical protein